MDEVVRIAKALADPSRVRILLALGGREMCVCQLNELFDLAPSTLSKHLSVLQQAGLMMTRKQERWVHCRRPGAGASPAVRGALDWVDQSLRRSSGAAADRRRLGVVLKCDPAELCRRRRS
jgi:DNA-binding transcriptional ArsR family regulator